MKDNLLNAGQESWVISDLSRTSTKANKANTENVCGLLKKWLVSVTGELHEA